MKELISQRALDLGFDACGFTRADPPSHARAFDQWLADENHGEMAYLHRNAHKRVDPQKVLAGAKTIIALTSSYFEFSEANSTPGPVAGARPTGTVARYARFKDYHDVLLERLEPLTEFVNQLGGPGMKSLSYVDTGPFLERDMAERAGLGFIGKHTNLISRRAGNWIFLSEIITTLELAADPPEKNRCGSCTRCLAACPTEAIRAPFQLDARRCISYLTIELKGSIPVEFRTAIGDRIYGCDDCLEVCPWNKFAREGKLMRSHARQDLVRPDLLELLALDEAGFRQKFFATPIWRVKRRGLLRNVCVALGNVGDATALPALSRAASSEEPLIAEHAAWAVRRIEEKTIGPGRA